MSNELLIAIVAGLGGMFGWGLADFFAKKTIDRIGDVQSLAWAGIFGSVAFAIAVIFRLTNGGSFLVPVTVLEWLLLIFFGLLQAGVYLFVYNGFSKGQVALLGPVFSTFTGIVALISITFLHEPTTLLRMGIIATIFIGIILLSLDLNAFRLRRIAFTHVPGFREVLIATLLAALWTVLWFIFVNGKDWLSMSTYMFIFMTVGVFLFAGLRKLPMKITSKSIWLYVALIGICETGAYMLITLGYSATSLTSVVTVVSGGFGLPTLVLAHIFLKERITSIQWLGCIIIIAGVMILPLV